ncbi:MAG: peptide chain release factor N(5)-glutamine methyltransferase [Rickettsiales bacterium]
MALPADRFLDINIKEILRQAVLNLQEERIQTASIDARVLLEHVLRVSREELLFSFDLLMDEEQYYYYQELLKKRVKGFPVAKLIGNRQFWGIDFSVNNYTLDPRPDSETVIESALAYIENRASVIRVLDLGTGSGCLLISLLSELPSASGVGVDCCDNALSVARKNAVSAGVADRVEFFRSNWCANVNDKFDVVLANPPYIPSAVIERLEPDVKDYEPMLALDGGSDGLSCYRDILKELPEFMNDGGIAVFEIGIGQEEDFGKIATGHGFDIAGFRKDLSGITRCVILRHNK